MLVCPDCDAATLEIVDKIELGANDWSDENALQLMRCSSCGINAIGQYEESRRGASDRFHHWGYRINEEVMKKLSKVLAGKSRRKVQQEFGPYLISDAMFAVRFRMD